MAIAIVLAAFAIYLAGVTLATVMPPTGRHSNVALVVVGTGTLLTSLIALLFSLMTGDWRDRGNRWDTHAHFPFWWATALTIAAILILAIPSGRRLVPFRAAPGLFCGAD